MQSYSPTWYANFRGRSAQSAYEIVPLVLRLVPAKSVIDVGCGLGGWLQEFRNRGVERIRGVDGEHVDLSELVIDPDYFTPHDLRIPLELTERFDLAVSLEVAEHLPEERADQFVENLTHLAPVILFSAAIPAQGGTNHINERWPIYWVERFRRRGFEMIDAIRWRIWDNDSVDFWYAQNTVIFANEQAISTNPALEYELHRCVDLPRAMVHPRLFERTTQTLERTIDYRIRRAIRRIADATRSWRIA